MKNTSLLIFKILPMLLKNRVLLMGNTVEMVGGDMYFALSYLTIAKTTKNLTGVLHLKIRKPVFILPPRKK